MEKKYYYKEMINNWILKFPWSFNIYIMMKNINFTINFFQKNLFIFKKEFKLFKKEYNSLSVFTFFSNQGFFECSLNKSENIKIIINKNKEIRKEIVLKDKKKLIMIYILRT